MILFACFLFLFSFRNFTFKLNKFYHKIMTYDDAFERQPLFLAIYSMILLADISRKNVVCSRDEPIHTKWNTFFLRREKLEIFRFYQCILRLQNSQNLRTDCKTDCNHHFFILFGEFFCFIISINLTFFYVWNISNFFKFKHYFCSWMIRFKFVNSLMTDFILKLHFKRHFKNP